MRCSLALRCLARLQNCPFLDGADAFSSKSCIGACTLANSLQDCLVPPVSISQEEPMILRGPQLGPERIHSKQKRRERAKSTQRRVSLD